MVGASQMTNGYFQTSSDVTRQREKGSETVRRIGKSIITEIATTQLQNVDLLLSVYGVVSFQYTLKLAPRP